MTAAKLGSIVNVSESTVVRFAIELGYEGYPEFQHALQEMVRTKLTSFQRMEVTNSLIGDGDVLGKVLLSDADKIKRTLEDIDRDAFFAKYGVEPSQFVDVKALMGDSSDNVPGVKGIGEKSKQTLLAHFKSVKRLREATEEEMYTTALATVDYIKTHYPEAKRLFMLGTPSMITEFEKAGFESAEDSADDRPDVLVVAFDKTLAYDRLCRAAWWISQGVPYIATNPDRVCPTDQPTVLVDCGSICKCIEHATGRQPDITLGKPDPNMLSGILGRFGYEADEVAMVGDRIYTDIEMAHNANAFGVLVLSGETTLDIADAAPKQPHLICDSIEVLGELIAQSHKE